MYWSQFVVWARLRHGLELGDSISQNRIWKIIWQEDEPHANDARAGVGTGHSADYGPRERRRVTAYLQIRDLVSSRRQAEWLRLAGHHWYGWLFDDGTGLRWVDSVAPMMESWRAGRAVVSIRCGE